MLKKVIINMASLVGCLFLLSSCEGAFDGIYDNGEAAKTAEGYGFVKINANSHSGEIYINATDYDRWTYINLHNLTIDSAQISKNDAEPEEWDFAVHRYDAKTNGGSALEYDARSFDELDLKYKGKVDTTTFVHDTWTENKIIVDMSGMMQGNIGYAKSYYNAELSKWLDCDLSSMPPTYTMSKKVYLLRLSDGTMAALTLKNFMNEAGTKGYMLIDYVFPYQL